MDYPFKGHGPLFLLLVAFLLGVFLGLAAGTAWVAVGAAALVLALLFAAVGRHPFATALSVMVLCGALTAGRLPLADPDQVRPFLDKEVVLRAVVDEAKPGDAGWSGAARDALVSFPDGSRSVRLSKVLLSVRSPDAVPSFPSEVRAAGRLYAIRNRGNPGELPREWSAMAMGVQYAFSTEGSKAVFLRPEEGGEGLRGFFPRIREKTGRWMDRHAGRSDGALYLRALTTGEVPPYPHPMVALLRKTGLAHLLAISGVNVAIFFAIHSFLVRSALWILRRRHGTPDLNRCSTLLSVPVCWGYVFMAGAPVPAVRSAGMITVAVVLWNGLGVRRADLAWSFLFIATLVASPFQVFSPSFLLSYGASFFLIAAFAGMPREGRRPTPFQRVAGWAKDAIIASAVAFLGTLPVSAAFFGSFPAGAILWNLIFGPVLGTAGVMGAFTAAVGGAFGIDALGAPVGLVAKGLTIALS
ncbi:MAG: ComEC/Rec2 family competence protein, partial [Deltaproteobacteria bacterium]|nr:ComEC/Rec2 family competence protein [Deltaproteobacteria bacterium]